MEAQQPASKSLFVFLQDELKSQGFPVSGAVDLDPAMKSQFWKKHVAHYENWLSSKCHAEMRYMERGLERRKDPRLVFPEACSVVAVLAPYPAKKLGDESGPQFARYLRGSDYHNEVKLKLENALSRLREKVELSWKVCVDTSAVLERTWAALCGLGWIGKNAMLIHPKLGSYTFIGIVLTSLKWSRSPTLLANYCGNCERCLHVCPTQALSQVGSQDCSKSTLLDSRKCIGYRTIEMRGVEQNGDLQRRHGNWVAGCDLCQEACPYNNKRDKEDTFDTGQRFDFPLNWKDLEEMDEQSYRKLVRYSALSRVKFRDFVRNLDIARSNASRLNEHRKEQSLPVEQQET